MKLSCFFGPLILAAAAGASGLPPLTGSLVDFEYTSSPTFTGYQPLSATVAMFNNFLLLYGSPVGSSNAKLELFDILNADKCYSLTCPSTTTLYPQPNYVLGLGEIAFAPFDIVAGTGVTEVQTDMKVSGALFNPAPTGQSISAEGMPVLFTGLDPGGASSFVYFKNADGTYSDTLHVLQNSNGGASLTGVILDPPTTLTLDILGFANPGPDSFVTPTNIPEPSGWGLTALAVVLIAARGALAR